MDALLEGPLSKNCLLGRHGNGHFGACGCIWRPPKVLLEAYLECLTDRGDDVLSHPSSTLKHHASSPLVRVLSNVSHEIQCVLHTNLNISCLSWKIIFF
jgi:hypothetical protein